MLLYRSKPMHLHLKFQSIRISLKLDELSLPVIIRIPGEMVTTTPFIYRYTDFNESNIPKYSHCGSLYKIQILSIKIPSFSAIYKIQF